MNHWIEKVEKLISHDEEKLLKFKKYLPKIKMFSKFEPSIIYYSSDGKHTYLCLKWETKENLLLINIAGTASIVRYNGQPTTLSKLSEADFPEPDIKIVHG